MSDHYSYTAQAAIRCGYTSILFTTYPEMSMKISEGIPESFPVHNKMAFILIQHALGVASYPIATYRETF